MTDQQLAAMSNEATLALGRRYMLPSEAEKMAHDNLLLVEEVRRLRYGLDVIEDAEDMTPPIRKRLIQALQQGADVRSSGTLEKVLTGKEWR